MRFEEALVKARKGMKIRRPYMVKSYLSYAKVADSKGAPFLGQLVLTTPAGTYTSFSIPTEDVSAEDWTDSNPISKVKMYSDYYSIRCPDCNKAYRIGSDWTARVGDRLSCDCGTTLLMEPPVEYTPVETKAPEPKSTTAMWPKAL